MSDRPRGRPSRVLVDTSAYYALVDPTDTNHPSARAVAARLAAEHRHLFTTNVVLAETHALVLVRRGRAVAARVLHEIDRSSTTIVRVSAADERRAGEIIAGHADKDYSLTDALSFAVMERLRIGQAFAFDRHFVQYGLMLVAAAADTAH